MVFVVVVLLIGVGCFVKGKEFALSARINAAETRSKQQTAQHAQDKVVNKVNQEDVVDAPVERVELEDFHRDEMEVSKRPDHGQNDDQPDEVNEDSFYQPNRQTSVV